MSFAAMLRKDLRECLPWLVPAVLIVLVIGSGELLVRGHVRAADDYQWPRMSVDMASKLFITGGMLSVCSLALGIAMAFRQFFVPTIANEWGFLVHRAGRPAVVGSKTTAGLLSLALPGCVWSALFIMASRTGALPLPPSPTTLAAGWISIAWGFALYLALSVGITSGGSWYGRKVVPTAFVLVLLFLFAVDNASLAAAAIIVGMIVAVLLPQLIHQFNTREF